MSERECSEYDRGRAKAKVEGESGEQNRDREEWTAAGPVGEERERERVRSQHNTAQTGAVTACMIVQYWPLWNWAREVNTGSLNKCTNRIFLRSQTGQTNSLGFRRARISS